MHKKIEKINSHLETKFENMLEGSEVKVFWGFPETSLRVVQKNNNLLIDISLVVSVISDDFTAQLRTTNLEDGSKNEYTQISSELINFFRNTLIKESEAFLDVAVPNAPKGPEDTNNE